MICCFILLLYAYVVTGIGYDSGGGDRATCGRPYRSGRMYQPPCDLGQLGYCTQAGQLYPWKAVRRFVKDNQGLMRRMYGDQRHGHVLREELDDDVMGENWKENEKRLSEHLQYRAQNIRFARYQNHDDIENYLDKDTDFDFDNPYVEEGRFLRDDIVNEDVLNTKFVVSEQEASIAIKLAELKAATQFKYASHRPTFYSQKTSTTTTSTENPSISSTTSNKQGKNGTVFNNDKNNSTNEDQLNTTTEDATTTKWASTKATTETTSINVSEGSTASTITDDFSELSNTDTTTDHTTEWSSKKLSTITKKPFLTTTKPTSIKMTLVSDKAGSLNANNDIAGAKTTDNKQSTYGKIKFPGGSANSEIISSDSGDADVEDGDLKTAESSITPAILFQDMEEDMSKTKTPIDYSKMKGVNACPVKEEVVAPFWANNTRGEVLALLNMYPFEQYVHWEKCTFEHRQMYCREGCRCEQQYRLHRLLAYDPNNECRGIFSDWFRFPSCCVCKCYNMPPEFRVTSRSPRFHVPQDEQNDYN
ncbi:spaetzle domain-containing protein 4 isoform X1 [Rhynchophorus ferrugineus]|uniref:spaetzle domain-containing protein 4 isoform X1 n=1 Tax=Rhynchophorus ferrugineus TaxID=354439 RepID=UPI003FCC7B4A